MTSIADVQIVNALCSEATADGAQIINWNMTIGAAILASLMILLLFYLFAILFRNDQVIAWIKIELFELISTLLIVMVLVALVSGLCTFPVGWIFTDGQISAIGVEGLTHGANMYEMAGVYLSSVKDHVLTWMSIDMAGSIVADISSAEFKVHPMGQGFVTAPMSGFSAPMKLILNNAMIAMLITYVVNEAMYNILKFSIFAFPTYFLPLGIVFRSFEPTRRFGGTLIALSISFLIIYPILFAISLYVTSIGIFGLENVPTTLSEGITAGGSDAISTATEGFRDFIGAVIETGVTGIFSSTISLFEGIFSAVLVFAGSVFASIVFFIGGIIVQKIAMIGFVMPAFNTIMLVYSMRSLGKTLGEPIDITSLTRVI